MGDKLFYGTRTQNATKTSHIFNHAHWFIHKAFLSKENNCIMFNIYNYWILYCFWNLRGISTYKQTELNPKQSSAIQQFTSLPLLLNDSEPPKMSALMLRRKKEKEKKSSTLFHLLLNTGLCGSDFHVSWPCADLPRIKDSLISKERRCKIGSEMKTRTCLISAFVRYLLSTFALLLSGHLQRKHIMSEGPFFASPLICLIFPEGVICAGND